MSELSPSASGPGATQNAPIEGIRFADEIIDGSFIVGGDDNNDDDDDTAGISQARSRGSIDPPAFTPSQQRHDSGDNNEPTLVEAVTATTTPLTSATATTSTDHNNNNNNNHLPMGEVLHVDEDYDDDGGGLHYKRTTDGESRITNNSNEVLNTNTNTNINNRTSYGTLTPPQSSLSTLTQGSPNTTINRNVDNNTPPSSAAAAAVQQQQQTQSVREEIPEEQEEQQQIENQQQQQQQPDIEQQQQQEEPPQQNNTTGMRMSNKKLSNTKNENITTEEEIDWFQRNKKTILIIIIAIVLLIVIIIAGVCGSGNCSSGSDDNNEEKVIRGGNDDTIPTVSPTSLVGDATYAYSNTINQIQKRNKLLCGVTDSNFLSGIDDTINPSGFNQDMCRAVAAGIFGSVTETNIEFIPLLSTTRFIALQNGTVDLLAGSVTHTMERDVYEATAATGFTFSIPYLYGGLTFGGVPPYGTCADSLIDATAGTEAPTVPGANETEAPIIIPCSGMKVCVEDGTTYADIVPSVLPDEVIIVSAPNHEAIYRNLRDGVCNAISGDQFETAAATVQNYGYFGEYEQGEKLFSKEPLTLVTRDDDGTWSDFVNWIIEALLGAEEQSITQNRANLFFKTNKFGTQYENMFVNAIRQVGNYGEMYERNLQVIVPRKAVNTINDGTSTGLIYAMPFGNTALKGPDPIEGSTLKRIKERGFLRCGITTRAIFSTFDPATESYSGFDIDMCRAVSAAIFSGVTNTIEYTNLLATDRFQFLEDDVVDLLSRVTTHTFERDVFEAKAKVGFSFSQPDFYDGVGFGGIPPYGQCADRQDTTSQQCQDLMICVNDGTTSIERVRQLFPERYILPKESGDAAAQGLALGDCNAIGGGVFDVAVSNIREVGQYDGPYEQGTNRYSKDPLALVTRQDDPQWSDFVYWVLSGIFYAEEEGITQESAFRMPTVDLFGTLYHRMLQNAVAAVGSYAEIYDRHVEADFARSGLNLLNEQPLGAQHYPLPGIEV